MQEKCKKMKHSEILSIIQKTSSHKATQQELANALGINIGTISARSVRDSAYSVEEIRTLEKYFNCNILGFNQDSYIDKLSTSYADKHATIPLEVKELLLQYYNQGIDLNWLITGKGNKYRASEFEQAKDELAQRMEKMENALRNAGILTD